jgi:hypothetical protein
MTRPADAPDWATDVNYADPGEDWDGFPTKVKPSAGEIGQGTVPDKGFAGDADNWIKNNHGLWIGHHDDILLGPGFHIEDDFTGTLGSPDPYKWRLVGTVLQDSDALNIMLGAAEINVFAAGDHTQAIETCRLPTGTKDFLFLFDVMPVLSGGTGQLVFGLQDTGGSATGKNAYFQNMGGFWGYIEPGAVAATATGIAIVNNAVVRLKMQRINGVVTASIGNTVIYTAANASDMGNPQLGAMAQYTAAQRTAFIDYIKGWIAR